MALSQAAEVQRGGTAVSAPLGLPLHGGSFERRQRRRWPPICRRHPDKTKKNCTGGFSSAELGCESDRGPRSRSPDLGDLRPGPPMGTVQKKTRIRAPPSAPRGRSPGRPGPPRPRPRPPRRRQAGRLARPRRRSAGSAPPVPPRATGAGRRRGARARARPRPKPRASLPLRVPRTTAGCCPTCSRAPSRSSPGRERCKTP